MATNNDRKVLTVFIGSPSDVTKERALLLTIVEKINEVLRDHGWEIELRRWENFLIGMGRPQERINPKIDGCDLFIGLLCARWGTKTGEYSSGFEEEFAIARGLHNKNGKPEVWLFFKQAPAKLLKKPDDQYKKVIEFREQIKTEGAVQFADLKTTKEWEERLHSDLMRYALQIIYPHKQTDSDQSPEGTPEASKESAVSKSDEKQKSESASSPRALQNLLKEAAKKAAKPSELSDIQAARLHLFSTAAVPENYNLRLENHVANLLYLHRATLHPTWAERTVLYTTLIADAWDHIPGWYWFLDRKRHGAKRLVHTAMFSSNEEVRRRATALLEKASIPLEIKGIPHKDLLVIFLADSSDELTPKKFECLAKLGGLKDIPILDQFISSSSSPIITTSAQSARARILARHEPNRILADIVEKRLEFFSALGEELAKNKDKLDAKLLIAAAKHPEKEVRVFAGQQLQDRGEVSEDLAKSFVADESYTLKTIGQRKLLSTGGIKPEDVEGDRLGDDLHTEKIEILSRQPAETLRSEIDWISIKGLDAYEALAKHHFDEFEKEMRSDLSNDFKVLRARSLNRLKEQYGTKADEILESFKEGEKLDRFIHESLVTIALEAIASQGKQSAIEFGRRYLHIDRTDARLAAIKILEQFGDVSDCESLLQLTKAEIKSIRRPAARAALKLSDRSENVLHALMISDDPLLVEVVLTTLGPKDARKFMHTLKGLLLHKTDSIRMLAVTCLHRLCSHKTLEKILEEHFENKTYFYNVACWLDRVLYAPSPLKEYFEKELEKPFGKQYD